MKLPLSIISIAISYTLFANTTDDIIDVIINNNPSYQISIFENLSEFNRQKAENALNGAEIEVGQEWGDHDAGQKFNVSISQSFDWPGVYNSRNKSLWALAQRNAASNQLSRISLEVTARSLLVDIVAQRQVNALLLSMANNISQMAEKAEKQWQERSITLTDYNKLRIDAARTSADYAEGVDQLYELESSLQLLAGTNDVISLINDDMPLLSLYDLDFYLNQSSQSAEIKNARAELIYYENQEKVARKQALPGFSLGYDYEREAGVNFHGFHVGVTLPNYSKSNMLSAKNAVAAAQINQATVENEILQRISIDYSAAQSLKKQMDALGPAIALNDNIELLNKSYSLGQIELSHYLYDVNYFLEAQIQYIRLVRDFNKRVISLNRYCIDL